MDKPIGRSFGDVEYYAQHLAGVSGRILEPAVGTGRILIPLVEAGFTVEGLDTSPEMLAVCRQHCRDHGLDPLTRQEDMTTFVERAAYAAVIIPTGSIALLDGREATLQALACFHDCLEPSGRLVVDVPPPQLIMAAEPMRTWRVDPFVWTLQTMHIAYDAAANQTTRWLRYEKWNDGALIATELQPFRLQHWSVTEFQGLLAEAGFTDITVAADYQDDRTPSAASEDWTFRATRA
ncbi:MAG: class I SAM-dependent methyltransferase [Candidatus Dormibacteria bacterium]